MGQKLILHGVAALFVMGIMGCGESGVKLVRVKGKVIYKGQPISGATVTFQPEDGPIATGVTDDSGNFTLTTGGRPGAVLGSHKVGITKMSGGVATTSTMTPDDLARISEEGMTKGVDMSPKSEIPEKYANPQSSDLVATVSENQAENEFEYTLVD